MDRLVAALLALCVFHPAAAGGEKRPPPKEWLPPWELVEDWAKKLPPNAVCRENEWRWRTLGGLGAWEPAELQKDFLRNAHLWGLAGYLTNPKLDRENRRLALR